MKKFESLIAKLLLISYLITVAVPALPAEGLGYLSLGKIKKVCNRSYEVSQNKEHTSLQLAFSAERSLENLPQAALPFFCGSSNIYIPARADNGLLLIPQQEKDFPAFAVNRYSILFQELDPDPPKFSTC